MTRTQGIRSTTHHITTHCSWSHTMTQHNALYHAVYHNLHQYSIQCTSISYCIILYILYSSIGSPLVKLGLLSMVGVTGVLACWWRCCCCWRISFWHCCISRSRAWSWDSISFLLWKWESSVLHSSLPLIANITFPTSRHYSSCIPIIFQTLLHQ